MNRLLLHAIALFAVAALIHAENATPAPTQANVTYEGTDYVLPENAGMLRELKF